MVESESPEINGCPFLSSADALWQLEFFSETKTVRDFVPIFT